MHDIFGAQTASDVGMYAQTLMLAMTAYGVASCSQGTLRNYPDFVRERPAPAGAADTVFFWKALSFFWLSLLIAVLVLFWAS